MKRSRPEILSTIVYADGEKIERKILAAIPHSEFENAQQKTTNTVRIPKRNTTNTVRRSKRNTTNTVRRSKRNTTNTVRRSKRNTTNTVRRPKRNTTNTLELRPKHFSPTAQLKGSEFGTIRNISVAKRSNRKKSKLGATSSDSSGKKSNLPSTSRSVFSITRKPAVKKGEKTILLSIIEHLTMKKCIPSSVLESLKEDCLKIKDFGSIFILLKDMLKALNVSTETCVTTRSRSNPTEEVNKYLINKNKALEDKLKGMLMNHKSFQIEFRRKEDELRKAINEKKENEKLKEEICIGEDKYQNLQKENEKLKEEIGIGEDKYQNLSELLKKKNSEIKHLWFKYQGFIKEMKKGNVIGCKACKKLKNEIKEFETICDTYNRRIADLKYCNEDLDKKEDYARKEVEELEEEVKRLKYILFTQTSAWPQTKAEKLVVMSYYFAGRVVHHPSDNKEDPNPNGERPLEEEHLTQCDHVYEGPSTSNSCPRCSIENSSSHIESAEDNLDAAKRVVVKFEKKNENGESEWESIDPISILLKTD